METGTCVAPVASDRPSCSSFLLHAPSASGTRRARQASRRNTKTSGDDEEGHGNEIDEPARDLADRGLGGETEDAGEQRRGDRARLDQPRKVERLAATE